MADDHQQDQQNQEDSASQIAKHGKNEQDEASLEESDLKGISGGGTGEASLDSEGAAHW